MTSLTKSPPVADVAAVYGPKPTVGKDRSGSVRQVEAKQAQQKPDETQMRAEQSPQNQSVFEKDSARENKANKVASALADKSVEMKNVRLQFEVSSESRRVVIKVLDRESGEIIRQIPPEEMVHVSKVLSELTDQKGYIVNDVT
ncbi:MAG TPA: flagellar protein FlaG [bacterium]|nr:flagellar protein FlaG [bacterium]